MKIAGYKYQSYFGPYIQQFLQKKEKSDSSVSLNNGSQSTLMLFPKKRYYQLYDTYLVFSNESKPETQAGVVT